MSVTEVYSEDREREDTRKPYIKPLTLYPIYTKWINGGGERSNSQKCCFSIYSID